MVLVGTLILKYISVLIV